MHIITAHDDTDVDSEFTVKVYPAEYVAAVEVRSLLKDQLKVPQVSLWTSNNFPQNEYLHDNLVCIGGPVHNDMTRILLEALDPPLRFDGYTLISDRSDQRYEAVIDSAKRKIVRDVGVAVLARNPYAKESSVTLMMGSRTFGCAATARVLTAGSLRSTARRLGDGDPRWMIIDARVVEDFVASVDIVETSEGGVAASHR